ncbi:MAG: T9SS type A sorting domain-containing protein [Flavobacteriales bacterium]
MRLYPNPANEYLQIQLESRMQLSWSVLDSDGRMVLSGNEIATEINIPTQSLATGAYILQLTSPSLSITRLRFVKE